MAEVKVSLLGERNCMGMELSERTGMPKESGGPNMGRGGGQGRLFTPSTFR